MKSKTLISILLFFVIWATLHFGFTIRFAGTEKLWLIGIYLLVYFIVNLLSKKDILHKKEKKKNTGLLLVRLGNTVKMVCYLCFI